MADTPENVNGTESASNLVSNDEDTVESVNMNIQDNPVASASNQERNISSTSAHGDSSPTLPDPSTSLGMHIPQQLSTSTHQMAPHHPPEGHRSMSSVAASSHLILDGSMFAVHPRQDCPHMRYVGSVPGAGINVHLPCMDCGSTMENWICITCFTVRCGRHVQQHMISHSQEEEHPLALGFRDLSTWCYWCDSYVDSAMLYEVRNAAYRSKFNETLPWSYSSE